MKRSNKINSKHSPKNRISSAKGLAAACRSDATTSLETEEDMNREKRVRFQDPNADHHLNVKPGATSSLCEAAKAALSDAPKTSEFAFFKKIKEKACSHSYQLHKEDNQVKDVRSRESRRETTIMFDQSRSYLRSSLPFEKSIIINQQCFPSPLGDASKDSGLNYVEPPCENISPPPLPNNKVKPGAHDWFSPSFGDGSRNSWIQYSEKGVFYAKRQKLRQWVADSSLPEVDELCSKGLGKTPLKKLQVTHRDEYHLRSSLVSVLLSRLFTENNENKCCRNLKSRKVVNDIEHQQTILPDSDTHVKRLRKTDTLNLNVSVHRPYFDDDFSENWSSRHTVIPKLDIIGSDSPSTSYAARTPIGYPYSRSLCNEDHNRITSFWRENDSSFHQSFEGYGSIPSSHLKELDYLLDYYQPESRVQAHNLLLSWDDVNSEKHVQNTAASSFNTDVSSFSTLETLWGDDKEQCVHSEPISLSPSFLENSENFPTSPNYHLDSFPGDDFQSNLVEDKYQGALTPEYLKLVEDCIPENTLESSRFELPSRTYVREEPFFFPTRLDFASGLKFLAMTDSFEEHRFTNDTFWFLLEEGLWSSSDSLRENDKDDSIYSSNCLNYFSEGTATGHDWSVGNFKLSRDNDIGQTGCCLLLHDSSWDFGEKETYSNDMDDDEDCDEWKYI